MRMVELIIHAIDETHTHSHLAMVTFEHKHSGPKRMNESNEFIITEAKTRNQQ